MDVGLDRLSRDDDAWKKVPGLAGPGTRVGLLAHPASVDRHMVHVATVLRRRGVRPAVIFGPEHGYGGEAQDMVGVGDARDREGAPVRSLYGATFDDLSPRQEDLHGLDLLVVDLQDVGARYYTFVWTAVLVARACAKAGVPMVILDRPNPLGCETLEGPRQGLAFRSFVGLEPVPVRHGLTLGEIVAWRCAEEGTLQPPDLRVVTCRGVGSGDHAPAWDRPFVAPSPNMPTYDTALVYPGGCLLEATNLSEGRGTTRPFELVGAPWLDGFALAGELSALGDTLPGVAFRPVTFTPTFHKHAGTAVGGVQVHVTTPSTFRPYGTYLALLAAARRQAPARFALRTEPYEFVADIPALDLLTGGSAVRQALEVGASPADLSALGPATSEDAEVVAHARATARPYLL